MALESSPYYPQNTTDTDDNSYKIYNEDVYIKVKN